MSKTLKIEGFNTLFDKDDLLNSLSGQQILEKIWRKKLSFTCICMSEDKSLNMHVRRINNGYNNYRYTIVRNKGTMEKHHENCNNYGESDLPYSIDNTKDIQTRLFEKVQGIESSSETTEYTSSELYSIGENLIFNSWSKYINENKELPNIEKLFKRIYEEPFELNTKENITEKINDIMFKPYGQTRYEDINERIKKAYFKICNNYNTDYIYVIGKVLKYSIYRANKNFMILKVEEPQKNNIFNLLVDTDKFLEHYVDIPSKADVLISSLIKITEKKHMVVDSFSFIPISNVGVNVSNDYEIEIIEQLIKDKILFIKPPKLTNYYSDRFSENLNPDFILIDKNCMELATVLELYGYELIIDNSLDKKQYWDQINKKINYYKSLENYNFFYWLVHKNPIPIIYQPKRREV